MCIARGLKGFCAQLSFLRISIKIVVAVITIVVAAITTLANSPHGMGDCAHHQCVVISVH